MITENPTNRYVGDGSGSRAIADYYLPANAIGLVRCKVLDVNSQQFPLWFSPTDDISGASEVYTGGKAVVYVDAGNYFYIDDGGTPTDSGILAVIGDQYRLRRTAAGVFLAEKTTDGINWTLIHSYTYASTEKHFVKMQTIAANRNLANPIYSGFVRRPIMLVQWGESNTGDGYADNGYLTPSEAAVRNIKVFNVNTNVIEGLLIGTNHQLDHAGLTLATHGISNGMANAYDAGMFGSTPMILCPVAQGGSTIDLWEDTDPFYTTMLSRITNCITAIQTTYGVKPSIVFHASQGLNNFIAATPAAAWKPLMQDFFVRVRAAIPYHADMLFHNFATRPDAIAYDTALNEIAASDKRVKVINTAGADLKDENHLQYNGQKIVADRVAHYTADLLKVFPPLRAGYLITVRLASASPCSQPKSVVYIDHDAQSFSVGDILYQDILMTIPVTGFTQVVDIASALIYNIDSVTGVIGAATGSDCTIASVDDLTFLTNTGDIVNTAQIFTTTGAGGFGHMGVDDKFLAPTENGIFYTKFEPADAGNVVFGFYNSKTLPAGFGSYKVFLDIAPGTGSVYAGESGALNDTEIFLSAGEYMGILKVGLSCKPVRSMDGIHWNSIHTYRGNPWYYSANHNYYPSMDGYTPGAAKLSYPRLLKYANVNVGKLFIQDGNSIAYGYAVGGGVSTNGIARQCYEALDTDSKWLWHTRAVSGHSIQTNIDDLPTKIFPLFGNGFSKIIVSEYEGVNYLAAGYTGLQCFDKFMEYANLVLNRDPRTCVMLYTCCASAVVPNAARLDFNARLLAVTETDRLKIANTTTDPLLEDHTNTAIFFDGTHMTDAGNNALAAIGKAKILEF